MPSCLLHSLPDELLDKILLLSGRPAELFHQLSRTNKTTLSRYLTSNIYWKEVSREWCDISTRPYSVELSWYLKFLETPSGSEAKDCVVRTSPWYRKYSNHAMIPFFWARKKFTLFRMDFDDLWTYVSNSSWNVIRWKKMSGLFQILDPAIRVFLTYELPDNNASIVNVVVWKSWIVLEARRKHLRNELIFYVWCSEKQKFLFPPIDLSASHQIDETSNYKYIKCRQPYLVLQKIPMGALSSEYQIWDLVALTTPVSIPITQSGHNRPFVNMYLFFYFGILEELNEFQGVEIHPRLPWFLTSTKECVQLWKHQKADGSQLSHCGNIDLWKEIDQKWAIERSSPLVIENVAWRLERRHVSAHLMEDTVCLIYASLPVDPTLSLVAYDLSVYTLPSINISSADSTELFGQSCHRIRIEVTQTSKIEEIRIIEMTHLNLIIISSRDKGQLRFILVNLETLKVTTDFGIEVDRHDDIHIRKMSKHLNFLLAWTSAGEFYVIDVLNPSVLGSFSIGLASTVVSTSYISFITQSVDGVVEEAILDFS